MIIECHMRNVVHGIHLAQFGLTNTQSTQIASCWYSTVHNTWRRPRLSGGFIDYQSN